MGVNNYVKLDAGFYFNPKTDVLDAVTRDAYFCSLCCAKLANQDGAFKIAQIQVLTDAQETDFETLFEAGFWERTNSPNIAFVHDYLDWNLSRDEEMRRAVISRNNGAKGGRPKEPKPETQGVNPGGKPSQVTEVGNPDPKPRPKPVKEGRKEGKKEGINKNDRKANNNNNLLRARGRETKTKTETTLPSDWRPTESHEQKCLQLGISLNEAVEVFKDWAGDEKTSARWNQTFATGLNRWIPQEILKRHEARDAAAKLGRVMIPLPDDWLPNGQGENLAIQAGIRDITAAVQAFRDWTKAKAVLAADWDAQWRSALRWLPDAVNRSRGRSPADELDRAEADLTALLEARSTQPPTRDTKTGHRGDNPPNPLPVDPETGNRPENPQNNNNHNTQGFTEPPF